jgi:hypothetical protein
MVSSRRNAGILTAALLFAVLTALAFASCASSSGSTTMSSGVQTTTQPATSSSLATTTTSEAHQGASKTFADIGQVMEVEQGELTVWKVTVTDNLASAAANALLLTGDPGETKNVSKAPGNGNEFLLITFKYKKVASYAFRGGLYSDDIILKNSSGKEYPLVETHGFGGISESNAGKVKPDVEAYTTAVYEVPKGETGLSLIYHQKGIDGFTCKIR